MKPPKHKISVVTELDKDEEVADADEKFCETTAGNHNELCKTLSLLVDEIGNVCSNAVAENTMPQNRYEEILETLENSIKEFRQLMNLID